MMQTPKFILTMSVVLLTRILWDPTFDDTIEIFIFGNRIYRKQARKIIVTMSVVLLSRILWGPVFDDTTEVLLLQIKFIWCKHLKLNWQCL